MIAQLLRNTMNAGKLQKFDYRLELLARKVSTPEGPPAEKSAGLPERVGKRLPLLNATQHDQLCAWLQSH